MTSSSDPRVTIELKPGDRWSSQIDAGKIVTMTAHGAGANVSTLLYNARNPTEKSFGGATAFHGARLGLGAGGTLLSDEYFAMARLVEDSVGWHDMICGASTRQDIDAAFGPTSFESHGNGFLKAGYENLVIELQRNGLEPRDMTDAINFFSKVAFTEDGGLAYVDGHAPDGAVVAFETLMPVIALFSNTPHPLNPASSYPDATVMLSVSDAGSAGEVEGGGPSAEETINMVRAREITAERMTLRKMG